MQQFRLPDPGEGLVEAEIVSWKVKPGDQVKVNDIVVEVETAKSLVELPIPWAGTVGELLVAEGDTVEVGTPIITIDTGEGGGSGSTAEGGATEVADVTAEERPDDMVPEATPAPETPAEETKREANLVGYGPSEGATTRRRRRGEAAEAPASTARPLAKPPVRKYAKDMGVDLSQ